MPIPLLPEFIDANTAIGEFVVERDRYVDGRSRAEFVSSSAVTGQRLLPLQR
ncbi:MAG: hypothetical protein JWP46_3994 [Modestobacter sp.]|nr:hypothetical protein [Modestobacter sp.]